MVNIENEDNFQKIERTLIGNDSKKGSELLREEFGICSKMVEEIKNKRNELQREIDELDENINTKYDSEKRKLLNSKREAFTRLVLEEDVIIKEYNTKALKAVQSARIKGN